MLGIQFTKTAPTTHVMHFKNGKIRREGAGLSFFYFAPTSTLVHVPIASAEQPFVFTETTGDFQEVTLQGQISYRIADPKRLAGLLDYSVDGRGRYLTEDPEVLTQRIVHTAQTLAHDHVLGMDLRKALVSSEQIGDAMETGLKSAPAVTRLGVEIIGLALLAIRPTPEMSRALEAESREGLQKKADGAIYERRNAAVKEERKIKENELNTDIAVEEKNRLIRESKSNFCRFEPADPAEPRRKQGAVQVRYSKLSSKPVQDTNF